MTEVAASRTERRVTWAELFFDLVFVFAITQVSALLHQNHSPGGVAKAFIVLVPVYWVWVGTSVLINTRGTDGNGERLAVFAVALGSLVMAMAIPEAYGERGIWYGAAYLASRAVLAFVSVRRQLGLAPLRRILLNPVSFSVVVTAPMILAGAFAPGHWRWLVWATAAVIDLSTPRLFRRTIMRLDFDAPHLAERFGLLLIIALGESVVAIGLPAAGQEHLEAVTVAAVATAFVLVGGLWWAYFAYAADAIRHSLATDSIPADILRRVLSYGHLSFIAGVIAASVGIDETVAHHGHRLGIGYAALLYGGCALYLLTFGYTRWRMFRKWAYFRIAAGVLALALLPVAAAVPALAALGVLAGVVVAMNVTEYAVVRVRGGI